MFEKEAKKYMHKNGTESEKLLNTIDLSLTKRQAFVLINVCKQVFKDGAELGYNKKKEEMQAQIEKMKCCEICAKSKDWRNRSLCVECEKSKSHINFELRR